MKQKFNKDVICDRYEDGEALTFIFFWGPGEAHLPKACFNQWHPAKFTHRNFEFVNAEQAMMAEKAWLFSDFGTLQQILECESPRAVKALGRLVQNYDDRLWSTHRLDRVVDINYEKFSQNSIMLKQLLDTGDAVLVEASPVDKIWGIGIAEDHRDCSNPNKWPGLNLLGEALMIVRQRLRFEHERI